MKKFTYHREHWQEGFHAGETYRGRYNLSICDVPAEHTETPESVLEYLKGHKVGRIHAEAERNRRGMNFHGLSHNVNGYEQWK